MRKLYITLLAAAFCFVASAQPKVVTDEPTDFMRSNGKIYVVVAVAAVIITGLFLYVLNLDRKITRLEKENKD